MAVPLHMNLFKSFCTSNAIAPASGAKVCWHRLQVRWALNRLWDDYRPHLTCFIPFQMILSPFVLSSESWKGFKKSGDDSLIDLRDTEIECRSGDIIGNNTARSWLILDIKVS